MLKKKTFLVIMLLTLLCLPCFFSQNIHASQTIRVGFIDYKGFIEKDESGQYSGYAVSYLEQIAKYTNWNYQYVFDTWEHCLEKLKNGDIDMLCSAQYTKQRDQYFDYSKYSIGNEYTIIYTQPESSIYYNDYEAIQDKTIGLLKNSYQNSSLEKYAQEHNFNYNKKYYNNEEQVVKALEKKEVDMIAVGSLPLHDNVKVVAKFDPQPFYITVKEGNHTLLNEVNESLMKIHNNTPYFEMEIFNQFYSNSAYSTQPLLTREEIEYIQDIKTIDVGVYADMIPFSYSENGQQKGILKDMLEKISEKTGLDFHYLVLDEKNDFGELFQDNSQKDFLFCGALKNDKDISSGKYWSSDPLLDIDQVIVTQVNPTFTHLANVTLALPFSTEKLGQSFMKRYPSATVQYYDSIEECLDAVNNKTADLTLYNTYTINYLIQKPEYFDSLNAYSASFEPISICISGHMNINDQLASILNKSIDSFSKSEKDKVVYDYTIGLRYEYSLMDTLYQYRYALGIGIVAIILIVILISILLKRHTQYLIDKKEADILREKIEIDKLTGLYNYETFFDKVKEIITQFKNEDFFMLCLDIDRFKIVNELYGMEEGDRLLRYIGQTLNDLSQKYTHFIACHLNADKFFVLLPRIYYEELFGLNILDNYPLEMEITARYGIYFISDRYIPIHLMCDRAALAASDVKGSYLKRLGVYNDQKRLEILYEQQIMDDIQLAIADNQLSIAIQAKYDIIAEKIVGGEALVRWAHPTKGNIPPNKFIPIVEANGYIIHLDYFVWEKTCQFIQKLKSNDIHLSISVNVSRLNFYRPHFSQLLIDLVKKYDLEPKDLHLEITESVYSQDTEYIYSIIHELQDCGFVILMDDFGSGYSSLNMLKDAPLDIIKLDMGFLRSKNELGRSKIIVEAITKLSHSLNIPVIVEGVETQQQFNFLKNINVQYIQGYYFSKAIFEDDFITLYHQTNKE